MPDPWETILATVGTDSILKQKMAMIDADLDAVAKECYDAVTGCK
jgi:hypothetical protein